MSAFLNSLHEEGSERDYLYWMGRLSIEKGVHARNYEWMTKSELFDEMARLFNLPKRAEAANG